MKIACVGDNCMDVYENTGDAFPGGNPVNVSVYTVRMGGEASYTGVVGDDENGSLIVGALRGKGVDVSHVRVLHGKTAVSHVRLVNGERIFCGYDKGVLEQFRLTDEDIVFLCGHDMVVAGRWSMVEDELSRIKARGGLIAFDFATRLWDEIYEAAIENVSYAFFSWEEDDSVLREMMKAIWARGPKIVTATLGKQGSLAYDGESYFSFGILPCEVRDTMGAGDSYIAGFLHGILHKKSIPECMRLGAECSCVTLQNEGAW